VGRPEENTSIVRPRRGWGDNIKIGVQEVGWGGMNWIYLTKDRDKWRAVVNAVTNIRFP